MGSPSRYFDIFGIEPSFAIDQGVLKERYFEVSKKHHPDRPRAASADDKTTIEEINKAYGVLKDDLSRARYLSNTPRFDVDKKFLMDVLDYEEAISATRSDEEQRKIKDDLQGKISQCKKHHLDREYLTKWGYYERLMEMLDKRKSLGRRSDKAVH